MKNDFPLFSFFSLLVASEISLFEYRVFGG